MSSRESTPLSLPEIDDIDTDNASEDVLVALLEKETDLLQQIESIDLAIHNLEQQVAKDKEEKERQKDAMDHDQEEQEDKPESEKEQEQEKDTKDGEVIEEFDAPEWCIPIKANVMTYDWESLAKEVQFDVIVTDPPWQLATHAPTRGVAIAYQQLPDICIEEIPIPKLSTNGFLFIWVINNKYAKAFELMERWGYAYVDDITWVKQTVNRRMAKGHGYYLQHAKETCLVGVKGTPNCRHSVGSDVIFSERRGQSQKPEELYEMIEELVPNGKYLEIFGRKNNLRDYWVTIGNEL
ncbi:MT-A70-domain-containing protein [Gilbertella persicaria]|uniref:MT-A70-domain-containing protein n=1 Tax=Gilbertella persicaria TaxID=101096 RepID=UPI00221FB545|nr:MT-A70-domain-containing protein [Gilbertella persicaria]KAI8076669.1 MT-A70-domain-containing protein [Gilbertella persicaria]